MTGYLFVSRDVCRNRQSVDRTGQLLLQDAVDGTAAVDPGLPDKLRRPDLHPEMRFAALAMAGLASIRCLTVLMRQTPEERSLLHTRKPSPRGACPSDEVSPYLRYP